MSKQLNIMDILKFISNKNNCKKCNEKTCLAFAASVIKGKKDLSDCPQIDKKITEKYGGKFENKNIIESEQERVMKELKEKISQIDLSSVAQKTGGRFSDSKLTLKVLGKDFSVHSDGTLSTDIHVNAWVAVPLLSFILTCKDDPVSGKWLPFRELKGGRSWQGLFENQCEKRLKKLADKYTNLFETLIDIFNGQKVENHYESDISVVLYPLPKVPMLICYWKPDDGLESDLNLFFDASTEVNLNIEATYALGVGLVTMFEKIALRHGITK